MSQRLSTFLLLSLFSVYASLADAQILPFELTGSGDAAFIPLTPGESAFHDADGTATFLGNYHAEGMVRLDEFTSQTTGNFSSAVPIVFTGENGDELHMDYAGSVELTPVGVGEFFSTWIAEFTPVVGSSTGQFANVIDGSILVTAITDPFTLADPTNVPYSWSGPPGWLKFIPEPSSAILLTFACLGFAGCTRHRR